MSRIYLDHAATTPLRPEAREAMLRGFEMWANPSSPHAEGRKARAALEDARERIKAALGWDGELIFTSGASEALALAIAHSRQTLAQVSDVEHDSVLRLASGARRWAVTEDTGIVGPSFDQPGLTAVQHANSETGVIQPIARVLDQVRSLGGTLLCDCAQTAGKIALPDADLIALSAHKFGGPIGIGALLVRHFALLDAPGGQERGYRGGTENLPAALGMAAALEAGEGWMENAVRLRARLDEGIKRAGGEVVAEKAPRIPTISSYRMPGVSSAAQLIQFDAAGFAVSAGSACSSGSLKESHVMRAMRYQAGSEVLRVSLGWTTTEEEIEAFLESWAAIAAKARKAA